MIRESGHLLFSSVAGSVQHISDWICATVTDQQEMPTGDLLENMSVLTLNKD